MKDNPRRYSDLNPGKLNAVRLQLLKHPGEFSLEDIIASSKLTEREEKALLKRVEVRDGKLYYKERTPKRTATVPGFFGGMSRKTQPTRKARLDLGKGEVKFPEFLKPYIPDGQVLASYIPRKIGDHKDIEILARAFRMKKPVLLVGESGTGKNHAVEAFCSALNLPHKRVNLNGGATIEDLIGCRELSDGSTQWRDGIVTQFCRHGGVVVLDEVNSADPEMLFVLHGLADHSRSLTLTQKGDGGEVISANDNFMIVGTMNPLTYEGTRRLNPAFLDRFGVILHYKWDLEIERKLIGDEKLIEFAKNARQLYLSRQISTPVTTRTLIHFKQCETEFGRKTAVELMKNRFPADEADAVKNYLTLLLEAPSRIKNDNDNLSRGA